MNNQSMEEIYWRDYYKNQYEESIRYKELQYKMLEQQFKALLEHVAKMRSLKPRTIIIKKDVL